MRVPFRSGDELGKVALAINRMMEKFSAIID
ncbi:HAMP domain-containing protein [Candidatus Vondammii sp. HM_W22]